MKKYSIVIIFFIPTVLYSASNGTIYRSEDANGRVTYSSSPVPNAKSVKKLEKFQGPTEKQILESDQRMRDLSKRTEAMAKARRDRERMLKEREQRARQKRIEKELDSMRKNPPPSVTQYPPGNPYNDPRFENLQRFYNESKGRPVLPKPSSRTDRAAKPRTVPGPPPISSE